MQRINFTKMCASGNDFVVIELSGSRALGLKKLAREICDRKFGAGADGLLALGKSKIADVKMRIFNSDGSEAQMCGNGSRCAALYLGKKKARIETRAGIIESEVNADSVKIKLTDPKGMKLDVPVKINNKPLRVNFINTGVPHTVIFVEGVDKIDVADLGRQVRYHKIFAPAGTNVNFVEVLSGDTIKVRTYERGVEDETFACGTGATASSLITSRKLAASVLNTGYGKINVRTRGGETLKVYFKKGRDKFTDTWLEGRARIVYKGVYYV
ncbi:MAG: diaminopimelate epimerase [Candidatus Omnitrophota bacterium]